MQSLPVTGIDCRLWFSWHQKNREFNLMVFVGSPDCSVGVNNSSSAVSCLWFEMFIFDHWDPFYLSSILVGDIIFGQGIYLTLASLFSPCSGSSCLSHSSFMKNTRPFLFIYLNFHLSHLPSGYITLILVCCEAGIATNICFCLMHGFLRIKKIKSIFLVTLHIAAYRDHGTLKVLLFLKGSR